MPDSLIGAINDLHKMYGKSGEGKFRKELTKLLLGRPDKNIKLPEFIWSRGTKKKGRTTGAWYHCHLEGCTGIRIRVIWPNGRETWPCSKGLVKKRSRTVIA